MIYKFYILNTLYLPIYQCECLTIKIDTHFHYRQPAQGKTSGIFLQINLLHRRFSGLAQLQFQHIKRRERLRKTYLKLRCVK